MVVTSGRAWMRAAGRFVLLACALLACAAARADAAAGAAALPAQGVYEGCSPGTSPAPLELCVQRLQEIADAGFDVVLNYSALYGTPDQVRAYAQAAHARGVRLIWPLHHPRLRRQSDVSATFVSMAAACGCSAPHELVAYMVDVVRTQPATWMYYVGDEVPVAEHDAMKALSELVRTADPSHERLVVQYGTGSELAPFADAADVLAADHYPLWAGSGEAQDVAAAARGAQQVADGAGKPMAIVLQAFSWGPYYQPIAPRWPTVAEYTAMRDVALANSAPRFVLWWAYYVIKREAEPERHWQELVAGALAPWAGPPALAPGATTSGAATPTAVQRPEPEVVVGELRATVRRRVAAVRFALSSPARVRITVRCGGRPAGERATSGETEVRRVRVWMRRHRGPCRATVAPLGGRPRTVPARSGRPGGPTAGVRSRTSSMPGARPNGAR